jgi:predicted O-methyltransferase YrrM/glycosyltransferase involved in cell wall biosynthesis
MNWKNVEGYFSYTNLYDIALKYCPDNSTFVEVGSWMGRSTCYMGEQIKKSPKNIKFYAVDTWEGSEEISHKETIEKLKNENLTLFDIFNHHLQLCGVQDQVLPLKTTSLKAAEQFEDNSLDFVHIDASHDYENVLADIIAWYPKVKPGGFITGDDYVINWGGVIQAVNEYFTGKSVVLLDRGDLTLNKVWLHQKQGEKMEVTLYAIAKNEEKNVERFIEISKKFTNTIVVDTGSTDKTVELLKEAGIEVYEHPQTREEFDFSKARNQALSYVKTDWAFSLDLNEDLDEFFPEGLGVIAGEFTAFRHERYDKVGDEEPTLGQTAHIRFHRTKNYTWVNAIHETPIFIPSEEHLNESAVDTTIKITKNVHNTVDKQLFYLSICEREFENDPTNTYYLWFIFKHYFEVKNLNKALELGQEYLNVSKAYFDPARVDVFIMCSIALLSTQNIQQASNYAFHALSEAMNMGGGAMGKAFTHLLNIGKLTQNPNIIIFASGFSPETLSSKERTDAIDKLFLTNLDDTPATAWSGHRQFAEWLVSYTKPEVTVDLGVDYGYSTFSFAIPRVGQVYGIDNFTGDDFVGTHIPQKYSYVMMKREKLHLQDNVTIIEGDFNEVAQTWDKKIDILHIDGSHHYEDVKKDFETWSKFVNDDGVILLHDTCIESLNGNEYGVKKFFDEIDLPKVTFTHSYGLGVVSKNKDLIETIKKQFNL